MSTHATGYIPTKDAELIVYAKRIEETCRAHMAATQWNLNPGTVDALKAAIDTAETAYNLNANPHTRNAEITTYKNEACLALKRYLSLFVDYVEGSIKVPDEAILAMGMRPRHPGAHQPVPVPTEAPIVALVTGQHHDVDIYFYTNQAGHPTEYLANKRYHGVLLQYRFETETEWQQKSLTKKHATLVFDDTAEGKYIVVRAAWLNPRLEQGPWGDIDRALVN